MAITYHAGKRIQGTSTDEAPTPDLTYDDFPTSYSGWTKSSNDATKLAFSSNRANFSIGETYVDARAYGYDIGFDLDGDYCIDFDFTFTNTPFTSSGQAVAFTFGISTTTADVGGEDPTMNSEQTKIAGYPSGSYIYVYARAKSSAGTNAAGNNTNTAFPNNSSATQLRYGRLSRSGTTFRVQFFSESTRETEVANYSVTTTAQTVRYLYLKSYSQNSGQAWAGYLDNIKIYKDQSSPTPVKPTNVQLGSRFEETDTRKIYYYAEPSQDFASVLSTYTPQFFLKLDEGSGTSLTNSGSTSGYTASITVSNSNPVWDTGVSGANKALKFTDNSSVAYIGHTNLPTESTGDNFTMGLTFKISTDFTGGDSNHHHLWKWNNGGLGFWQMNMTNDGYIGTAWFNGGWQHLVGTTDSSDNAWHTFFVTCTSGSAVKGYLDGIQEFSGTANRSGYAGNDVDWIGQNGGSGVISYDNAFFKNTVMTASEISSLHTLLVPPTTNEWKELGT